MDIDRIQGLYGELRERIGRVIVGQHEAVELLFAALLSQGHVLLEGPPGTAKTLLAQTFSTLLSLDFKRVQFTPDLMPGDLIGTNLFDFRTNEFKLTKGPIFTQMMLADELNRTPPKTQAALLEAMQERRVTVDGTPFVLGDGFMVIATQNPIEQEGTYPLPEAQLDRFLFKVIVDYPSRDQERKLVALHGHQTRMPDLEDFGIRPLIDLEQVGHAREAVSSVEMSDPMIDYVVDVVRATRNDPSLLNGASPRACNMLATSSRAIAAMEGRDYVIPDDVKRLAAPTLSHRLVLAPGAEIEGLSARDILQRVVQQVEAPK